MKSLFILLSVLGLFSNCQAQQSIEDQPNIILIISEDNSPFLGAYGDEFATTPNLDKLASQGTRYIHAFANAPVCAPARNTMMTGMYPPTLGTEHMRSVIPIPEHVKFFTYYLRQAGYFTSNRLKEDYNTVYPEGAWDVARWFDWKDALEGREEGKPFFIRYNTSLTHESQIHTDDIARNGFERTMNSYGLQKEQIDSLWNSLNHDPEEVSIPPYHPPTLEMKSDWAKYYDRNQAMDMEVGMIIEHLKKLDVYDNTIIVYFSDHGGVLGRSKRFLFESGLHVPFIVWAPEKYQHLVGEQGNVTSDRLISFVDIAPTVLSLAGVEIPAHFQGKAFLGGEKTADPEYVYGFRGRMDERYDFSRTVFDGKYRYTRNYNPDRIYLQHLNYLWRAPSMASWDRAYQAGELDSVQSMFFHNKPVEELYDVSVDPHNINSLVSDQQYKEHLVRLRTSLDDWMIQNRDIGLIPEGEIVKISREQVPYDYMRTDIAEFERIKSTADMALKINSENSLELMARLTDKNVSVRYWAVYGLKLLGETNPKVIEKVESLASDESVDVQIQVAEALYNWGEKEISFQILKRVLTLRSTILDRKPGGYAQPRDENAFYLLRALNLIDLMGEDSKRFEQLLLDIPEDEEQFVVMLGKRILNKYQ